MKKSPNVKTSTTSSPTKKNLLASNRFLYGDEVICYEIKTKRASANKNQQITIAVKPDCRVVVSAPQQAEKAAIHQLVLQRAPWIWQALTKCRARQAMVEQKRYISGETQFYLGRRYALNVVENAAIASGIKMEKGKLLISLTHLDNDKTAQVKALVTHWYQARAEHVFQARLTELVPRVSWVKAIPPLRCKAMRRQWGSCSAKGKIALNLHLIKAPTDCIDYVILHELCHLAEFNHSKRFWALLTEIMPQWKQAKQHLDDMAACYLNE